MKPILKSVGIVMMLVICSCATPAIITSSWHKPDVPPNNYDNIFVAAVTMQLKDKQQIEDNLQIELEQKGLKVEKSMVVFPSTYGPNGPQKQNVSFSKIRSIGANGVLTLTLVHKARESYFEPLAAWQPLGDEYIATHPDEFIHGNTSRFQYDGHYRDDIIYYVDTRFYNAQTQQLIWQAQSKTYDPNNINGFVKGYIQTIYAQMVKDGVIATNNSM